MGPNASYEEVGVGLTAWEEGAVPTALAPVPTDGSVGAGQTAGAEEEGRTAAAGTDSDAAASSSPACPCSS